MLPKVTWHALMLSDDYFQNYFFPKKKSGMTSVSHEKTPTICKGKFEDRLIDEHQNESVAMCD